MRQAVLLEPSDVAALRAGTPLTLQVDGTELLLLMARSGARDSPKASRNGTRRTYTEAQRRALLRQYAKVQYKTSWLERHSLTSGLIAAWKKRYTGGRPHA